MLHYLTSTKISDSPSLAQDRFKLEGSILEPSSVLEVRVHQYLRRLTAQSWPHGLTMGRLVARALRRHESAILQTGHPAPGYRWSYLLPLLLLEAPSVVVSPHPPAVQGAIELLSDQFKITSQIKICPPPAWLAQPEPLPTAIEGGEDLLDWIAHHSQVRIAASDWEALAQALPHQGPAIAHSLRQIQHHLGQRPPNPYQRYSLTPQELQYLKPWQHQGLEPWPSFLALSDRPDVLLWAELDRHRQLTAIAQWADPLAQLPAQLADMPLILMGTVLDPVVSYYPLMDNTHLTATFAPSSQPLRLYTPNWMPMPNSSSFQELFLREAMTLLHHWSGGGLAVVIVGDTPLLTQAAARLAAHYGSAVKLEDLGVHPGSILVTGWEFWQHQGPQLPPPQLMIVATLPIPSLEDPPIAQQVEIYKRQRQDWFRTYLLPMGLRVLLRSSLSLRANRGTLAILDNRFNHRSYGQAMRTALEPWAKVKREQVTPVP